MQAERETLTNNEITEAHKQVCHMIMGSAGSMCLKCILELNILDIINAEDRPVSYSDLLSKLPNVPSNKAPFLQRMLRLLAHLGYFELTKGGGEEGATLYALTPLSKILVRGRDINFSKWVLSIIESLSSDTWKLLSEWLQSDSRGCTFEFQHNKTMFEMAGQNPEFNSMVNEFMDADNQLLMRIVVDECKEVFQGLRTLVDVGGGNGSSSLAIANAFPGLKCTVYDLPHVVASVRKTVQIDAVGGDMFEHVPHGDAIFLKFVMHDWADEQCVEILKNCKMAIPDEGGKVIIVDIVVKDGESSLEVITQLFCDVGMMLYSGGKERKEGEWKRIFLDAGFTGYKITTVGLRSLIEVYP